MLDQHSNTWFNNGKHSVPGEISLVSMQNDVMVATLRDVEKHPDVCGVVYNLTTINNNNNSNVIWEEFARLTTKGDPVTSDRQRHWAVSIEESMIFTSRLDELGEGVGKVFLHKLPNNKNGQN